MSNKNILTITQDDTIENSFTDFVKFKVEPVIEYFLYIVGMIVILLGSLSSIYLYLKDKKENKEKVDRIIADMRIRLAESISLGLTFILGAEVVKTFRVPNFYQLIKITVLVILRQLITYFLDKDVERLKNMYY